MWSEKRHGAAMHKNAQKCKFLSLAFPSSVAGYCGGRARGCPVNRQGHRSPAFSCEFSCIVYDSLDLTDGTQSF